jgi:hypothetical protein
MDLEYYGKFLQEAVDHPGGSSVPLAVGPARATASAGRRPAHRGMPFFGVSRHHPILVRVQNTQMLGSAWEYWVFQKEPTRDHNGLMHVVLVTLDSLGPSVYTIFGLVLIFGSMVVRRLAIEPTSQFADAGRCDGVEVRIRSKKVVPINRNTHVSQHAAFPVRRVGNYS